MKKLINSLLFLLFLTLFINEAAHAIPAFARKYNLSCQTCHNPIPRLKPYGDDFAGNGFALADQEAPRYYQDTGDPLLNLIRDLPIAVRLEGFLTANLDNQEQVDFGTPYLMKFMSGGSIAEDIAYYFYFYFDERGEVAGVEDAYIMFNDLFGIDFDIYAGQFQVSDPLFKRELRLTLEDYHLYTARPEFSDINLAYDRGIMLTLGTEFGTGVVAEIINGNGLSDASGAHIFDKDKYKNFMFRLSQDIYDFTLGGFVYWGKERLTRVFPGSDNEVLMFGPDISIPITDIFQLNLQYLRREDNTLEDVTTDGALAELVFLPNGDDSRWYATGLFNYINMVDNTENEEVFDREYMAATLHLGYILKRNIRLVTEFTYDLSDSDNAFPLFSVGFISAF